MNSLEQELIDAKTALKEANRLYQVLFNAYLNLPSGTSERDEAKAEKVKNDAKDAIDRIQAQIDQILKAKDQVLKEKELDVPLKIKEMELAQGKFIFLFYLN
jgi:hypothetical protein